MTSPLTDKELIQKAKENDKEAFKELFDRYGGKVLGYLTWYIKDYQKAQEITLDTFMAVYAKIRYYKEEGKFTSWLFTIATNFAKKELRKKRPPEVSLEKPIGGSNTANLGDFLGNKDLSPDSEIREKELHGITKKIIAELDEKYRSVLMLCDVDEMSYEEAGRILKCDKMTVGMRLKRARKLLHDALKKHGYNL